MSEAAGLYVHVPFCAAVCPYCDFAVEKATTVGRAGFVEALLREISLRSGSSGEIDTIYFGGGTPTALSTDQLARLVDAVRTHFRGARGAGLHLEANPEDVGDESAKAWKALGVEFLSLGIQSFDAATLRTLGRRHGREQALAAVGAAQKAGIATVSVDLIYGLLGEDPARIARDIETASRAAADHVSCYQLTIHERTVFGKRAARGERLALEGDDEADHFFAVHARLADAGLAAYEASNFARSPAHRSRHNRKYWRHVPYLGLGPSAHSFDGRRRSWNHRGRAAWLRALADGVLPTEGDETLSDAALIEEAFLLGLRTAEGVDLLALRDRTFPHLPSVNVQALESAAAAGLLGRVDAERIVPTIRGMAVADELAGALLQ